MKLKLCNTEAEARFCDASIWDENSMGRCQTKKGLILVDETMPELVKDQILIHEIIHYIGDCLGIGLTEAQVSGLSVGIHGLLVDNPEFVKMICKEAT